MSTDDVEWNDFLGSVGATLMQDGRTESETLRHRNELADALGETPLTSEELRAEIIEGQRSWAAWFDTFHRTARGRAELIRRAEEHQAAGRTDALAATVARLREVSA